MSADLAPRLDVRIEHGDQRFGGVWRPSDVERRAAWELTVELTTRVPIIPLREDEGLLEEALASLAAIFGASRQILRTHGPLVAEHRKGELSLAVITGVMLNQVIRPVTAYWHPLLSEQLELRDPTQSRRQAEAGWDLRPQLVDTLARLGVTLSQFADCFAAASGAQEFLRTQLEREHALYEPDQRRRAQGRR